MAQLVFLPLSHYAIRMDEKPITHQIRDTAIDLLRLHPDGLSTGELNKQIAEALPDAHPKTINGVVWLLADKNPKVVEKPKRGLFRYTG